jgi:hypothetical protein
MRSIDTEMWSVQQQQRINAKMVEPGSVYIPPVKWWKPLGMGMTRGVRIVINPTPSMATQLKFKGRL